MMPRTKGFPESLVDVEYSRWECLPQETGKISENKKAGANVENYFPSHNRKSLYFLGKKYF